MAKNVTAYIPQWLPNVLITFGWNLIKAVLAIWNVYSDEHKMSMFEKCQIADNSSSQYSEGLWYHIYHDVAAKLCEKCI